MKILLDECVVQDFRRLIAGHEVFTVGYLGWSGTKNGVLLAKAAQDGFDAIVTTDREVEHQQNLASLPLAIVVLMPVSNDIDDLAPLVPQLLETLKTLTPRTFHTISSVR